MSSTQRTRPQVAEEPQKKRQRSDYTGSSSREIKPREAVETVDAEKISKEEMDVPMWIVTKKPSSERSTNKTIPIVTNLMPVSVPNKTNFKVFLYTVKFDPDERNKGLKYKVLFSLDLIKSNANSIMYDRGGMLWSQTEIAESPYVVKAKSEAGVEYTITLEQQNLTTPGLFKHFKGLFGLVCYIIYTI